MAEPTTAFEFGRFVNVRRAYGPSFSPDGRRIGFIADLTGVPQAFAVSLRGGWPEQLTFTQDRVGMIAFSPTDDEAIVATDQGGDERIQLWRLAGHGETMRPLTHDPRAMHPFGAWSPDGRRVAFTSNERDEACLDVCIYDIETGATTRVWTTDGQAAVEAWSPDGQRLLVARPHSSFDNDLVELTLADGTARHLTPSSTPARFERATYDATGTSLWLLTDRDSDVLTLARLDLATLEIAPILDVGWDVEDLALSPDGRQIAYVVNVDGYSELLVRDIASRQTRSIQIPGGVIGRGFVGNWRDHVTWAPDGARLAFSLTTARETQNIWLADLASGRAQRLTQASQAGIPIDALAEPRLIRYPTFDRRQIPAFLYHARGVEARGENAAIVLIHGGPESQIRPGFDATIQYFAHRGYVVLTPNVRGSTGYGKAYAHLDDLDRRIDAVADARAAADWLVAHGWADRDRIAVMGQSYGGFMVLASLATNPETWAAGIDLYGIANFVTFMERTHPFRRRHRAAEYGSLEQHRELLERISPLRQVDRMRAPLLAVHGENDLRVPIGETEQVIAALRARGIPTELIRLPDEGHGIVRLANRLRVYPAIADFLDRHLDPARVAAAAT